MRTLGTESTAEPALSRRALRVLRVPAVSTLGSDCKYSEYHDVPSQPFLPGLCAARCNGNGAQCARCEYSEYRTLHHTCRLAPAWPSGARGRATHPVGARPSRCTPAAARARCTAPSRRRTAPRTGPHGIRCGSAPARKACARARDVRASAAPHRSLRPTAHRASSACASLTQPCALPAADPT